jgi:hypothetical protein
MRAEVFIDLSAGATGHRRHRRARHGRPDLVADRLERLAWTAWRTFLVINDQWITASEDESFDSVIRVAA